MDSATIKVILPMKVLVSIALSLLLTACAAHQSVDVLIVNGAVYDGTGSDAQSLDIGLCGKVICAVSPTGKQQFSAKRIIDATGMVVSPGFIDPHTHAFAELQSADQHTNLNYLYQGVTTVVAGNDGGGPAYFEQALASLNPEGIGTNLALFAGHGSIRKAIMGTAQREATDEELKSMQLLVENAMQAGALGLSSGLYYVPGQFANTEEVIELARVAAKYGGIYDTHLRDESSFNIGFLAAVTEAIEIAKQAGIHLHIAHIKALGVDVWGQSVEAIKLIEQAQTRGVSISADQYPWLASGTNIRSAIVPKWAMADSESAFMLRLQDVALIDQIKLEIKDNIRRRGGANKLLITASAQTDWVGKTLYELAEEWQLDPVEATLKMVTAGRHRVASYNMNPEDVERFMQQPWVVTSSDGTNGHPRKFASFPKKFRQYVREKKLLTLPSFIHASTGQTAAILGLNDRGLLQQGMIADVIVFDPDTFADRATFSQWNIFSTGIVHLWVNGELTIDQQRYTGSLAGEFVTPTRK